MFGFIRQWTLRVTSLAWTAIYRIYRIHPSVWRWTARNYRPGMSRFARLNAWMICQFAYLDVPAYREHLDNHDFKFKYWALDHYTPTDKVNYIKRYSEPDRCWKGKIKTVGTIVDESSGSSGKPYNWVRSKGELSIIHRNMAGYVSLLFDTKNLFCINAFSMGAWATGTNTGIAMAKVAMVKNTGPDIDKILDTLRHFGNKYTYLITAYPPFLKHLRDRLDAEGFDWGRYSINGFVGGEAITEGLRDYLQERFTAVYSGYGASDLTIGMAGESDLTVWLRHAILKSHELRQEIIGENDDRVPMIFQYNPLETYLETNSDSELLVTLNSTRIMSPKLRYNIGDEAKLMSFPEVYRIVSRSPKLKAEFDKVFVLQKMKLPFLFLFGRKDSTISYMGANIYPLDVENGLYLDNPYAHLIESFTLSLDEIGAAEHRPAVHLQLRKDIPLNSDDRDKLTRIASTGILRHLTKVSRDVAQSLTEDSSSKDIQVRVHDYGTGVFAHGSGKIKNVYLHSSTESRNS